MRKENRKVLTAALLIAIMFFVWLFSATFLNQGSSDNAIQKSVQKDTHNAVRVLGFVHRHGVTIVRLQTPKGPEIAYLIAGKYLAIGPLMDLKTGKNVTPIWEKIYAK
ncbi:MAG: hypothetical protein PHO57_03075 [Acidithiobacillus sp.]|nr:hypothetical protein [Acidithiobacillus sp.]